MKFGDKLKQIIGVVAPVLGTALGGPFGGMAATVIQTALGVTTEQDAIALIEKDPDTLLKLKQANMDFEKQMAELGIKEEQLHAADRASARNLGIEKGVIFQMVLSATFITGYFFMVYLFFTSTAIEAMDPWAKGQLGILLGVLTTAVVQIMTYWFGSSSGSKHKTDAMLAK